MLGATVDITERKRAEEALKETDRRKDEFLATLAHELRNPLAPIRTAVQILHLTGSQEAESRQVRDMVERQVDHLVRLVDDLLDMSRISRGKIELRRQPVLLAEVVQTAMETSAPFLTASRHELSVTLCTEPLTVDGDVVRLTQVVANLLNNAAKYTPQKGRITLTVEREDQEGIIRVRDTGLGIPPDMLGSVFEMFTQVNRHLGRAQGGLVSSPARRASGGVRSMSTATARGRERSLSFACRSLTSERQQSKSSPASEFPQRRGRCWLWMTMWTLP
jgi:signal transduction histidine kinase